MNRNSLWQKTRDKTLSLPVVKLLFCLNFVDSLCTTGIGGRQDHYTLSIMSHKTPNTIICNKSAVHTTYVDSSCVTPTPYGY